MWAKTAFQVRTNAALRDTNEKLAVLAEKMGCRFIDCNAGIVDEAGNQRAEFSQEGMHMYPAAYVEVFKALLPYL